jgi:hypothetical protein
MLASMLALGGCGTRSALDPFPVPARPAAFKPEPSAAATPPPAGPAVASPPAARDESSPAARDESPAALASLPDEAPPEVEDGRYAGLSILTAFHGDCNAGGTGEILVSGRSMTYNDARNSALSGPIGADGGVDVESAGTRLTGRFAARVFTGRIAGGPCEYQMRFERVAG